MVRLTEHDEVSRETVRRRLKENDLKPWRGDMWCIPKVDAEYVARMIDKRQAMESEIAAWQQQGNAGGAKINWMVSSEKARNKRARA